MNEVGVNKMSYFEREDRYLVFKYTDIKKLIQQHGTNSTLLDGLYAACRAIDTNRRREGKDILKCAVVEHDWPEYEIVWDMIKNRVESE
jgi:hypothetical protein